MGGGSMQMTYTLSEESAAEAANITIVGEKYVQERNVKGRTYHFYAHSYLNYGLLVARGEILKVSSNSSHPWIVAGYDGIILHLPKSLLYFCICWIYAGLLLLHKVIICCSRVDP